MTADELTVHKVFIKDNLNIGDIVEIHYGEYLISEYICVLDEYSVTEEKTLKAI